MHHPKMENQKIKTLTVGTRSAKSLFRAGKTHNIVREMKKININILWWAKLDATGQIDIDDSIMYYAGNNYPLHYNDVAIIMDENAKELKHINITQMYTPTAEKS